MLAFLLAAAMTAAPPADPCTYDRDRLLTLDQNAFDQDLKGGWRVLDEKGCHAAAADLIRDYRHVHDPSSQILLWHEGQERAVAGETKAAIALFNAARSKKPDHFGWNFYVEGSIAFLKHDRAALESARNKLAALPKPAEFNPTGPDGKPISIDWPPNLNILDGFLTCFNRSYEKAYGTRECAKPLAAVQTPDR